MQEYLRETFNPGGHLSRHLEGYSLREPQLEYAAAVDLAITQGRHLMVEGPTGTGKTLSYSVPAIYHAVKHQRKVLIVTSNIVLQEQLMTKDLPLLRAALPWAFTYKMLKGKANYVCLLKTAEHGVDQQSLFPNAADEEMAQAVLTWATMTPDGDKSGLPFEPPAKIWSKFSTTPEDCGSGDCPVVGDCFSVQARAALDHANVVVTNYHVLFSHLKVLEATGRPIVLPPFDVLIMDEGHHALDIARDFLGFKISQYAIEKIAGAVGGEDQGNLLNASEVFFGMLEGHFNSSQYKRRLKQKFGSHLWGDMVSNLDGTATVLSRMAEGNDGPERTKLRKASKRAAEMAVQIELAMTDRKGKAAYYLEDMRGRGVALRSKTVDISDWVRTNLFDNTPTVVVTSATLATAGTFDYIAEELGADHYDELIVDSPFDWGSRVLTVMPAMPDPRDAAWPKAVADMVCETVKHASGRTLVLFTSYRSLNNTYDYLRCAGLPYRIMKQGEMPRAQLVEDFKDDPSSVLLGTDSFWGGVDVPGEALSCVVVDKLPFPNPSDPVMDLLQEHDDKCFFNHSVPRAIIKLKQGVGRLIRRVDDYGVVVLLDCRLSTKGYGRKFIRSLPRTVKTRDLAMIGQFLGDMQAHAFSEGDAQIG